jgi:hypothetical protein
MNEKIDLNKLRDEISSRRKEVTGVPTRLGQPTGQYAAPKDEFLSGLVHSLKTGQPTPSSRLLAEVDETSEVKFADKGGKTRTAIPSGNQPQQPQQIQEEYYKPQTKKPTVNLGYDVNEREEKLFKDIDNLKHQTLAGAIEQGINKSTGMPNIQYTPTGMPQQINESALITNMKDTINGYLAENLMPILEESTRSVIIEMYAAEKLKTVLKENK